MARVTGVRARKRALEGWETRRRLDPSRYGNIHTRMGKTYWQRPNGEKIPLKRFKEREIEQIKPALVATDMMLKPSVKLELKDIRKTRTSQKGHYAEYTRPTYAELGRRRAVLGRPSIAVDKGIFKPSSRANPAGLTQHEIGHAIFPGVEYKQPRNRFTEYQKAFGYKQTRGQDYRDAHLYKKTGDNILKGRKTRQSENGNEDFAETYRALSGLSASSSNYWDVHVNKDRVEHLNKHYLR